MLSLCGCISMPSTSSPPGQGNVQVIPSIGGIPLPGGLPMPGGLPSQGGSQQGGGGLPGIPGSQKGGGLPGSPGGGAGKPGLPNGGAGSPGGAGGPPIVMGPDSGASTGGGGGGSGSKGAPHKKDKNADPSNTILGDIGGASKPVLKERKPTDKSQGADSSQPPKSADGGGQSGGGGSPTEVDAAKQSGSKGEGDLEGVLATIDSGIKEDRAKVIAKENEDGAAGKGTGGAGAADGKSTKAGGGDIAATSGGSGEAAGEGGPPSMPNLPRSNGRSPTVASAPTNPTPSDIGSSKDDDVIARQLREAAGNEPDPTLRDRLWDEYRRYKQAAH